MGTQINVTFDSTVYTGVLTSGNLALTPVTPTPTPPTPPSPVSGMHEISLVYYGPHSTNIDNEILAAKPAIQIDNTPAGLWAGNCNPATFQAIGTIIFSYIWYNFGQAGSVKVGNTTITVNSGAAPLATNQAFIRAIAAEGTKGVFIDCAPSKADVGLSTLCKLAHSLGLTVIVNPGTSPADESLYSIADYVMASEAYTGQSPTGTEKGQYLNQTIVIGFSGSWTAQQAATYSNDAWAANFPFTYSCQNYNQLPSWFTTYIALLNK